jgi:hypothetical protein
MNKSVTLLSTALLAFGLTAGAMAADMPKSAAPTAADTPSTTATDAPKPAKKHKKHKKSTGTSSTPAASK